MVDGWMTADKMRIVELWEVKNIIGACGERPFVACLVRVTGEGIVSW